MHVNLLFMMFDDTSMGIHMLTDNFSTRVPMFIAIAR
jgi:hypothetical protein